MKVFYAGLRWPLYFGKLNDAGDIGGFLDLVEEFLLFGSGGESTIFPKQINSSKYCIKSKSIPQKSLKLIGENETNTSTFATSSMYWNKICIYVLTNPYTYL